MLLVRFDRVLADLDVVGGSVPCPVADTNLTRRGRACAAQAGQCSGSAEETAPEFAEHLAPRCARRQCAGEPIEPVPIHTSVPFSVPRGPQDRRARRARTRRHGGTPQFPGEANLSETYQLAQQSV